ncbi:MAG: glycosyltransferase family 39 protein [Microcoleus vaginatus WJT46-NPBG5]|jgi:4-amino-4-deoxy-L-arabinose transferase-like glycosyltransferase|nr:glycosyltransferase family 39 protein [Microcoleus vaginatus WJT46-NPBG5]
MHFSNKSQIANQEISQKFTRLSPELWIILIAGLVRILWAIAVPVVPVSDSYAYDTFAQNLATGQGYGWNSTSLTAYWPVGTSFIYSVFYRIFGHTYAPIIVFNGLLAAVIIAISMRLAKIWFNRRIALITGLLIAIWPSQVQFTTVLNSELIFTALVLIALIIWLNEPTNLWVRSVLVGVVLAAACYVRPTALLIPILLLFFRWVKTRQLFKSLKAILIVFVLMAVLIAPWSIRNTRVFGQFVTISTNGGANFWMGNNPKSTGGYMPLPPETKEMNEAQRDKYLKSIATTHVKEQPLLFLRRTITRLIDTHSRESIGIGWNEKGLTARYGSSILLPLKIINQIYWLLVLGLALTGIVLLYQQHGWIVVAHPVVVIWGYFAAIHAVIVAQDRYHFPSIPMIGILAAFTLAYWFDRKQKLKNSEK